MSDARKLAVVVSLKGIAPIPGRDTIGLAAMNENYWKVIVKKPDFQDSNLGVYFEIDSWLPERPGFEFLKGRSDKTYNERPGYRIKSMRMAGEISQGLLLPLAFFPELQNAKPGQDVSDALEVELYEVPETAAQTNLPNHRHPRKFPYFIRKTDEERIQTFKPVQLAVLDGREYLITEKLDGTSTTYYVNRGKFGICSRNIELSTMFDKSWFGKIIEWFKRKIFWTQFETKFGFSKSVYEETALKYQLHEKLLLWCKENRRNIAVQGETVGPGISSNRLKQSEIKYYVFNIWDIDKQCYLDWDDVKVLAGVFGLETVPVINERQKLDLAQTPAETLIQTADGKSMLSGSKGMHQLREGLVYRERAAGENPSKYSFKIISNEYLLKHGI